MLMTTHLDGLTLWPNFFNSVTHFRTSAKADADGPPNVASSKYHTFFSDHSDDAISSIAIAKRMVKGDRLVGYQ